MTGRFDFPNHTQDEVKYAVVYGYEAIHFVDVEDAKAETLPLARHLPLDAAFSIIYTMRQTAGVHDPDMEYALIPENVIADTGTWMERPDRKSASETRWEAIRDNQSHGSDGWESLGDDDGGEWFIVQRHLDWLNANLRPSEFAEAINLLLLGRNALDGGAEETFKEVARTGITAKPV